MIVGRQPPPDIRDRLLDRAHLCGIRPTGPGQQNLQPFAVVETAVARDVARHALKTTGLRLDVFKQFLFRHGRVLSWASGRQIRPISASTRTITSTRPSVPEG